MIPEFIFFFDEDNGLTKDIVKFVHSHLVLPEVAMIQMICDSKTRIFDVYCKKIFFLWHFFSFSPINSLALVELEFPLATHGCSLVIPGSHVVMKE